jgi:hypothetical protein
MDAARRLTVVRNAPFFPRQFPTLFFLPEFPKGNQIKYRLLICSDEFGQKQGTKSNLADEVSRNAMQVARGFRCGLTKMPR